MSSTQIEYLGRLPYLPHDLGQTELTIASLKDVAEGRPGAKLEHLPD